MTQKIFIILLFLLCINISLFAVSDIKITEVFFRSTGDSVDFIQLYNTGNDSVSLNDWKIFTSDQNLAREFSDIVMLPGQLLLLKFDQNSNTDEVYSDTLILSFTTESSLSISSDYVILTDDDTVPKDAVIWSRYKTDDPIDDFFIQAINLDLWKGFPKGNSCVTPLVPNGFSLHHSIKRYFINNTLFEHNEYSYLNWVEIRPTRPGFRPPRITEIFQDIEINIEIKDTPQDVGGNLTVELKTFAGNDFYRYNVYITDNPVRLTNTELSPEVVSYTKYADEITVTTMNGQLLENNKPYYILVTYTNKYGYEYRNVQFTKFEYPIQQLTSQGQLLITELVVNGGDGLENMIEIYCVDDGNNGNGMNLAGYSIGNHSNVYNILNPAAEVFRGNLKIFENAIIKTGQRAILIFNTNKNDDRAAAGNVLKTYTYVSGVTGTEEIVVLYNPFGDALDAVPYGRPGRSWSIARQNALAVLYVYNLWNSNSISSAIDASQMTSNYAAKRRQDEIGNYINNNSSEDWLVGQPITVGSQTFVANKIVGEIKFTPENKIVRLDGNSQQNRLNIELELLLPTTLTVRLYDVHSRMIREVMRDETYVIPSTYNIEWDGKDYKNSLVPAGIYILMIDAYNNNYGYRNKITKTIVVGKSF